MAATLRTYLELVRFSHTIFALPFAIMAVLIAIASGDSPVGAADTAALSWLKSLVGILVCMVTARTAAMAFNRLVDRTIDAANPRTASRHLPRGAVGTAEVLGLVVASCAAFIAATLLFLPNWLPVALSVPVLAWLLGYSYAKRFTMLAHVWLGIALGLAPVAAWIALRGEELLQNPADILPAAILGLAVTVWVAGFDTIYACQDAQFDAANGLQSIPARLGVPRALSLAASLHGLTLLLDRPPRRPVAGKRGLFQRQRDHRRGAPGGNRGRSVVVRDGPGEAYSGQLLPGSDRAVADRPGVRFKLGRRSASHPASGEAGLPSPNTSGTPP
jgi:4-hydroxybenzoate polyprenyltransferase